MLERAWRRAGAAAAFGGLSALLSGAAWAVPTPGGINFQPAATEPAEHVHQFHSEVLIIITAITLFVTALLAWVAIRYNKKANPVPRKFSHNTLVEILWTTNPGYLMLAGCAFWMTCGILVMRKMINFDF